VYHITFLCSGSSEARAGAAFRRPQAHRSDPHRPRQSQFRDSARRLTDCSSGRQKRKSATTVTPLRQGCRDCAPYVPIRRQGLLRSRPNGLMGLAFTLVTAVLVPPGQGSTDAEGQHDRYNQPSLHETHSIPCCYRLRHDPSRARSRCWEAVAWQDASRVRSRVRSRCWVTVVWQDPSRARLRV
jgi:hypothetical protein